MLEHYMQHACELSTETIEEEEAEALELTRNLKKSGRRSTHAALPPEKLQEPLHLLTWN